MLTKATFADLRLRRPSPDALPSLARFVPSRRSLLVGAGVLALAASGYAIARETSLFAINRVDVTGGSAALDGRVAHALAPFIGRSLVGLDGAAVLQRADALPSVVSATYDRAFPNTLRLRIVPERPVAVLRDGTDAWIVSERGRVIRRVAVQQAPPLSRIWIGKTAVHAGELLPPKVGGTLTRALAEAGSFRSRVETVSLTDGQLVFHLRSGLELVLGSPTDIPLKVAVAGRVFQQIPSWTRVVDVSVPSRPVSG